MRWRPAGIRLALGLLAGCGGASPPPLLVGPRVPPDRAEGTVTVSVTVDNGEMATGTHQFHLICLDGGPPS